jgi:thiol-disulfide isomerase/thioredoxin
VNVRVRWALAAVVLVAAGVVAFWPRGGSAPAPSPDLSAARSQAALTPCATGGTGPQALRGVTAECLADGGRVDVEGALGGHAVLVNVWATWCEPCRGELPILAEYSARPGSVAVVGLAVKSPPADALGLLAGLGVKFPNLLDTDGSVERALNLPAALPASYLIAPDGTITMVSVPRVFRSVDDVSGVVTRYLGGV